MTNSSIKTFATEINIDIARATHISKRLKYLPKIQSVSLRINKLING